MENGSAYYFRDFFYGLLNKSAGVGFFLTSFIPGPWNIYWLWNWKCEQLFEVIISTVTKRFSEKALRDTANKG